MNGRQGRSARIWRATGPQAARVFRLLGSTGKTETEFSRLARTSLRHHRPSGHSERQGLPRSTLLPRHGATIQLQQWKAWQLVCTCGRRVLWLRRRWWRHAARVGCVVGA
jgi:hypothetical protein